MQTKDASSCSAGTQRPVPPLIGLDDSIALFLDIDGTLVGFRKNPADVTIARATVDLLVRIAQQVHGALALVSGRALHDIDRLFPDLAGAAAGLHGAQIRFADGTTRTVDVLPPEQERMRRTALGLAQKYAFIRLEDKGLSIALHVSSVPELKLLRADARTLSVAGYDLQPGRLVLEFKPSATDKGIAISSLLATAPFVDRRPLYFGDDLTDEKAFAVVNQRGGVSVLVGPSRASAATFQLAGPAEVVHWLMQCSTAAASVLGRPLRESMRK